MNAYEKLASLNNRCKYIFNIIQKEGPLTKNELMNKTGIKFTTLNRDMQILIDSKIVAESAIAESTGGRRPVLYDVNPYGFYSVGVDISRTYTQIVITNLKINIVAEEIINDNYNIDNIIDILPERLNNLFRKLKIENSMVAGIGIGIVKGFPIKSLNDRLIKEFGIAAYIDNGENAAVIGEHFFGLGKDKDNIAYINCGVGIRTGVISSGVLIRTINNSEDAFGHMIVDTQGEPCSCGNLGCVESYASISKITEKFISEMKKNEKAFSSISNKDLNEIDYRYVCSLAEDNNNTAIDILLNSAKHFGIGLSNYIRLFNPQLIILSGPLVQYSQLFYDECKKIAIEKSHIKNNNISFSRGGYFKNKSIAVGASVMAIENLINSKL